MNKIHPAFRKFFHGGMSWRLLKLYSNCGSIRRVGPSDIGREVTRVPKSVDDDMGGIGLPEGSHNILVGATARYTIDTGGGIRFRHSLDEHWILVEDLIGVEPGSVPEKDDTSQNIPMAESKLDTPLRTVITVEQSVAGIKTMSELSKIESVQDVLAFTGRLLYCEWKDGKGFAVILHRDAPMFIRFWGEDAPSTGGTCYFFRAISPDAVPCIARIASPTLCGLVFNPCSLPSLRVRFSTKEELKSVVDDVTASKLTFEYGKNNDEILKVITGGLPQTSAGGETRHAFDVVKIGPDSDEMD